MISTSIIPLATATAQEMVVEITEQTCRPFCVNSGNQPSASVAFSVVAVREVNGNAIATIQAVITVVSPDQSACGCAKTQLFTETFDDTQIFEIAYLFYFADEDWKGKGKVWQYMQANKA